MRVARVARLDRREERVGIGGKTAVDHQRAVRTGQRDDVAGRRPEAAWRREIGRRDRGGLGPLTRSGAGSSAPPSAAATDMQKASPRESA